MDFTNYIAQLNLNPTPTEINSIISSLAEIGVIVDYYFIEYHMTWQTVVSIGNDLHYFGSGRSLAKAIIDGLQDI